ncbi:hypothetical protein L1987_25020 [Smallanthus sonchifolius]|uniref:Uncharacterized protein n=1 Tax=Smallanthus sonchifolius TaxID=185202 RepID=A0ACB9IMZ8_9ASTR|nr:hypothetical protein L1987_25020 [Smallanthus sonchifolius]
MVIGVMEVNLVDAHGLTNSDFFNKIDPYVLIQYRSQEHKSTVAKGQGKNPNWNEKFTFRVEYPGAVVLKIMDHDTFSSDDYLGQTTIYLKELLELGVENGTAELRTQKWKMKLMDKNLEDGKRASGNALI